MSAKSVAAWLIAHRRRNALLMIAAAALFSLFSLRIQFENSVESFISPTDPAILSYERFKAEFGDDQVMLLAVPTEGVFRRDVLAALDRITESINALPRVRKVRSITNAQDIAGSADGFEVQQFIRKIPDSDSALAAMRDSALANPLYQIDLISLDGKTASIVIEAKVSDDEQRYKKIRLAVDDIMRASPFSGSYYFAGDPIVELQMTADMWKDLGLFIPLTYLCLALLLFSAFRDRQGTAVPLLIVSLGMGALQGLIGAAGVTMNAVTVGLPSLMLCIGILDCIHVLTLYRRKLAQGFEHLHAIEESIAFNLKPCGLTSITTAVGFASISLSELIPIRQFGLLAAYCTLVMYPICFLVMPYLLERIPPRAGLQDPAQWKAAGLVRGILRMHRARRAIPLLTVSLTLASIYFAGAITVETNHLKFLKPSSPVRVAADFIEAKLGGSSPIEIRVETAEEGGMKSPRILRAIDRLQQFMIGHPSIDKTISPVQFIKEMHQAMNGEDPAYYFIPDSRELIAQYILTYSFSGRDNDLDDYVDYDYRIGRIRGRIKQVGSTELIAILDGLRKYIDEQFEPGVRAELTSHSVLQANMVTTLVKGQMVGLLCGLLIMAVLFGLIHRSLTISLISLIPNILPIIAAAGLMGLLGISLNAGTAMTACIAFGLMVDDTLFFLHYAREYGTKTDTPEELVERTLTMVGVPVLYTSMLLSIGFGILVFGHSYATVHFGLLCATTILVALLTDLFLLPWFIYSFGFFRRALGAEEPVG